MSQEPTRISDDQRRAICRIVFLLICVLPTAAILYFIMHRPGPQQWEQMVRAELGLPVTIESVETPTPSLTILRGVSIFENENSEHDSSQPPTETKRIEQLAIAFGEGQNQIVVMDALELDADSLTELTSGLARQLGNSMNIDSNWHLRFKKVTLVDPDFNRPDFTLQPIDVFVEPTQLEDQAGELQDAVHVTIQTQTPGRSTDSSPLGQIWMTAEYTAVTLDTRNERLPMYLARSWQRQLDQLGAQCTFDGKLSLLFPNEEPSQLTGSIAGNLHDIQLDQITGVPGNGLRGSCDLYDFSCSLDQGRIDTANLQVASNGAISVDSSWVNAVRRFGGGVGNADQAKRVSLSQLNFGIHVRDGMVRVANPGQQPSFNIPVQVIAMALAGERSQGTRSIAILDLFKIPAERIARHPTGSAGDSLHR